MSAHELSHRFHVLILCLLFVTAMAGAADAGSSGKSLPFASYKEKAMGCWLGKAIGGTLGGPVEGKKGPLSLTFYDPVPDRMLPNDDLDLQVVWLEAIRRRGLPVDRRTLADAWMENVHFWPDEYGVAFFNLGRGLFPPASGAFSNGFTAGMGAAIRTELWACLAPGDPSLAGSLAREDACVDHEAEGVYSAVYFATLESAAFLENDRESLLNIAAASIPSSSRVARAVADTRRWWAETGDWRRVRERVLAQHGRQNFTDVAQNLAFTVLGWLAGDGDFGRSICTAVNCGADTDCTGATLGALLGILDPKGIDRKWLDPIGRSLVLSPGMVGMHAASTLDEFSDQVGILATEVLKYYGSAVRLADAPAPASVHANLSPPRFARFPGLLLEKNAPSNQALVATQPLVVQVVYPPAIALIPGQPERLTVRVGNPAIQPQEVSLALRVPDHWGLTGAAHSFRLPAGATREVSATVTPPSPGAVRAYRNPIDMDFKSGGLAWTVTASLVQTIPWLRWEGPAGSGSAPAAPPGAERIEAAGFSQPLPSGSWILETDVKIPYQQTSRFIVQAPRKLRLWVDGELLLRHDGAYLVPAVHRAGGTGKDFRTRRGWHRITVEVEDGAQGDLVFVLGDGETWQLLPDVEYRLPER